MTETVASAELPEGSRSISRRDALKSIGVIVAASALVAIAEDRLLSPSSSQVDLLSTLNRSTFARYTGDSFQLRTGASERMMLQLTQVSDLPAAAYLAASAQTEAYKEACFSIVFRSTAALLLSQGTYQIAHSRIGKFALFLVPRAAKADGQYYEAVFNRLID